ncbi:unnamed protein product, partial [Brassica rapa]
PTDSHRCPVCDDGQPQTSFVCWRTPTYVLCVLNRQPMWAKITRLVHGKGQRAESKDQRADMCTDGQPRTSSTDVLCVLADTHGRPVCTEQTAHRADMCTDGQPQMSSTDVLCVLADTHGRPVQPTWAKITRTVHGMGQHAESKDQRADIQPMWAKITRLVHGKGQRAESKDQRADMCTDGQPRTSYSPCGPKSPELSTGRVSVLSPRTNVLICVLMDSHGRPVCADGHTRTHTESSGRPVQPTWAKITQTVHGKGQRTESKNQRADMCTDGQPQTSCVRTHKDVLCVLTDTHGRPLCADGHTRTVTDVMCVLTDSHGQPRTSCVCWRTPTDVLCVLNRQPTWSKITQTFQGKGQRAESKDQRVDMCTDGQPRTSCVKGQRAESTDQPTDVLCVLTDTHEHTRTATNVLCVLTNTHRRPACADGHTRTSYSPRGPKSPKQSTGRASVLSPRTIVLICVLMDSHGRPVCADGHGHTWTATDVLSVLTDSHGRPVCPPAHPQTSC